MSDIVDWLQTSYGKNAIAVARRARAVSPDPLAVASCLNRELDLPSTYRAAATLQAELQDRLIARWGEAPEWLLTRDGIEQATAPAVRTWRSRLIANLGVTRIADLGCGLGFEAASFREAGMQVVAVERDMETAAVTKLNLRPLGVEVREFDVAADVEQLERVVDETDAVFVDPARRDSSAAKSVDGSSGNRVTDPDSWSPSWSWVLELAKRQPKLVAKVAPGIDKSLIPADAHTTWFQHRGTLVEASVWFGGFGLTAGTSAVAVDRFGEKAEIFSTELSNQEIGKVSKFILDPVGAVTRSSLVTQLAHRTQSHRLDEHIGYLSCEQEPADSPLFTTYEVIGTSKVDEKALAAALADADARDVQIQARGWKGDIDALTKKLRRPLNGTRTISVLIARIGDKHTAIVCQRLN